MRVLFTALASSGHYHPLVPVARALQQAGHEVGIAIPASFVKTAEAGGFRAFKAGIDFLTLFAGSDMKARQQAIRQAPPDEQLRMAAGMFIDGFARAMVPDALSIIDAWRPDLIVRDTSELGGAIAAEKRGIPHASIQVGATSFYQVAAKTFSGRLDALRAQWELPPDPEMEAPFRYLHLSFMPPSYFSKDVVPRTSHFFKLAVFDQSGAEGLPAWAERLGDRPVVYATLGTAFNKVLRPLAIIAEGLRDEPLELVITVGRDQDPAELAPQPPNVHVERYIPQTLLFPKCSLAIMHGGYNSVMSALANGLPMILVPISADQPMNAQRCAELGLGKAIPVAQLTPEAIREATREVLRDNSYRDRVRRLQAESQALPGMERAVELLERLGREKQPLPAG